ncbi:antimicrobial peptide NK-lysin-like [Salminus brasiliensis]|uniref:antimicrobial peptide NK-lysin-like n=1 Tax=Salminus brasiliensis TaxID=930266 RepID=UPI003B83A4A9
MLKNVLFTFLLIGTACAMHLEYLKIDPDEEHVKSLDVTESEDLQMPGAELPGLCWACKWAMDKLKRSLGSDAGTEAIKTGLHQVCDGIGFLRFLCKNMINQFFDVLVEELSTTDNAETICSNIGLCSWKTLLEFIQALPENKQKL